MSRLITALLLCLLASATMADQSDPRLNPLFEKLKGAHEENEAVGTANEIWKIWFQYRDADIAAQLQEAVKAKDAGNLDQALEIVNKVVERAPDFAEAWNQRAIIYYNVGYYDASLKDVEETLKLEPRHFGALSGRGMCYLGLRDPDAALDAFEEALYVHPWLTTARTYAATLREREAIRRRNGLTDVNR
ncbi:MAG: tetratricopeptide repeat protein [Gammaproteobacteria bacterium]